MADAQCVIRSSQLSAWQSTYRHYVRFELACLQTVGQPSPRERHNGGPAPRRHFVSSSLAKGGKTESSQRC